MAASVRNDISINKQSYNSHSHLLQGHFDFLSVKYLLHLFILLELF